MRMITLRVDAPDTALFRVAAAIAGRSINGWAREVLREHARETIHRFKADEKGCADNDKR